MAWWRTASRGLSTATDLSVPTGRWPAVFQSIRRAMHCRAAPSTASTAASRERQSAAPGNKLAADDDRCQPNRLEKVREQRALQRYGGAAGGWPS